MTTSERLVAAEQAYHSLMIGESVVELRDQSGEMLRFTQANASRLKIYIAELKAEIAGTVERRGPMRPVFGS